MRPCGAVFVCKYGKIVTAMAKVKQRNWLLLITVLLLIGSGIVLFINAQKNLGLGVCYYNDMEYYQGDLVSNYEGGSDCYCSITGDIVCESDSVGMTYETFSSSNLAFSYKFQNFLEKANPDLTRFTLSDVSQNDGGLEIILEREALCSEEGSAPTQVGMYEKNADSLVLTTITNRDEALYSRVCVIENTFNISQVDITDAKSYSLLYQGEGGQLYDLKACYSNGKLYASGEVFKDSKGEKLCTCEGPEISCEKL